MWEALFEEYQNRSRNNTVEKKSGQKSDRSEYNRENELNPMSNKTKSQDNVLEDVIRVKDNQYKEERQQSAVVISQDGLFVSSAGESYGNRQPSSRKESLLWDEMKKRE